MKKKPIIILAGCSILSLLVVFMLFALTEDKAAQRYDFVRTFHSKDPIREATTLDLGYSSYYIAGATADNIYFGNSSAPLHMVASNNDLTDTAHIKLTFENGEKLRFKNLQVKVDSPYFLVSEGTQPYLLRGRIDNWYAKRFMFDSAYFSLAVPISPSSFAIRSRSAKTQEDMLGKESFQKVELFPGLLEKQIDGLFCVDGTLLYNKQLQVVVYVYYYRNQFLVMDTSMNLRYKGNTIDPIRLAEIKADSYSSKGEKTLTMSSPPLLVNKTASTYRDWLLVSSGIHAKNEDDALIDGTSVIDVYDLKNQNYQFSFYISNHNKNRLSSFALYNNRLYAKFGNHIVSYYIPSNFFENQSQKNL